MLGLLRSACWGGWLISLAVGATSVGASIRPTFSVDAYSWSATHIALVETTASDGVFSVVESFKGDLKPGDTLEVPDLRPDKDAVPLSSYWKVAGSDLQNRPGVREQIPRQPIGSRMILFLKKGAGGGGASPSGGVGTGTQWGPAGPWGAMKVSALWIDSGRAFCFQQRINPGPSELSPCWRGSETSSEVTAFVVRIKEVLEVQRHLADTLALKDAEVRAERLGVIALGDVYEAQRAAMEALAKAGTVALPEILQVMDKPPAVYDGDMLIHMFVEAAGKDSGRQVHARLQQDLAYWRAIGPTMTQDWLGNLITPGLPLFVKFNETVLLVRELNRERYPPAAKTAAKLHDFWVSQPQLYDAKWGGCVRSEDCRSGSALDHLHSELFEFARDCEAFVKRMSREKPAK